MTTPSIAIVLNGEPADVAAGQDIASLVASLGLDPKRLAVEKNKILVRRPQWQQSQVVAGDRIEIVELVGGG